LHNTNVVAYMRNVGLLFTEAVDFKQVNCCIHCTSWVHPTQRHRKFVSNLL